MKMRKTFFSQTLKRENSLLIAWVAKIHHQLICCQVGVRRQSSEKNRNRNLRQEEKIFTLL